MRMVSGCWLGWGIVMLLTLSTGRAGEPGGTLAGPFHWQLSAPLLYPASRPADECASIKDPTVVFHDGKWHVFTTIRSRVRTHQIEYVSFDKWEDAAAAPRHVLTCYNAVFCAPQVFYFTPHKKWYLLYQVGVPDRAGLKLQPAVSTTDKIADPASWSPPRLLFPREDPAGVKKWLDFWIICTRDKAYLFFTSLDGKMWRMWTPLERFPDGFDHCELALQGDFFEASHTYRLKGQDQFLTIIEANPDGKRYYQAYLADRLDGPWSPLANREAQPFAGAANVRQGPPVWADNISHGELIRAGGDETMTVDPAKLQFLIQGVAQAQKAGKPYGAIPWRLGLLTRVESP